jgi:hypothetical protein
MRAAIGPYVHIRSTQPRMFCGLTGRLVMWCDSQQPQPRLYVLDVPPHKLKIKQQQLLEIDMTLKLIQLAPRDDSVYLGIWANWSQGSIAGLTFTTTLQNGGLLIAFLALYITFTGSCFWTIVSFTIHQISSRQGPQNAMYHQRQAILRNSDTSAAALWRLLRMTWSWRKRTLTATARHSLWSLALSLTTFIAFAIAGVFSSRVATSRGGEVLVLGDKCATLNDSLFTDENVGLTQTYLASRVKSSVNYASNCYSNSGSTDSCRTFVKTTLPLTVTRKMPCPFPGKGSDMSLSSKSRSC